MNLLEVNNIKGLPFSTFSYRITIIDLLSNNNIRLIISYIIVNNI